MKIKDVAKIQAGTGFPEKYQGKKDLDYGFYKVGDISKAWLSGSDYLNDAEHEISKRTAEEIRGAIIPSDSIVFAKIGEALKLNRRALTKRECLVDNNVFALIPNSQKIVPKFLYYYSQTLDFSKLCRATTVPSLRKGDIEEIEFPDFEKDQQIRIIHAIETQFTRLDAAIKSLKAIKAKLDFYRKSVLKAAFNGELVKINGKWVETILSEEFEIVMGQSPESKHYNQNQEGLPFFQGKKEFTNLYAEIQTWSRKATKFAEKDDVLLSIRAPIGPVNLAPAKCGIGRGLAAIKPNKKTNSKLVLYLLKTHAVELEKRGTGTTFRAITKPRLHALPIMIPNDKDDRDMIFTEIESRFSVIDKVKCVVEDSLVKAEALRKSILKSAFEGKLI